MTRPPIHVVCAVVENDGKVLACLRPPDKHLGGLWEFPGGKIEPGEEPASALRREIREELRMEIEVGAPLSPVSWDYGSVCIVLHPFRCRILSGNPWPTEHNETRWCDPEELCQLDWAAADVPICHEWIATCRNRKT